MPRLSIVLLTWNEARNITAALRALARQSVRDFELIVIDAASTDGTVPLIEAERGNLPFPMRLVVADRRLPIGEARNRGVALAQAPLVAFVSADAELDPRWVEEALAAMQDAGQAFGRQVHVPHEWTVGASVRGLRYHFPSSASSDPLRFASNVAAIYRREALLQFPFDPWANAAEDLLLAQRAQAAGFPASYNPRMLVHHHDVASWRGEWRKSVREGYGWALYAKEIGHQRDYLVWGLLVAAAIGVAFVLPLPGVLAAAVLLWLPAVRRAWRHRHDMPLAAVVKGAFASPVFDLAFLVQYLRGTLRRLLLRKGAPASASTAASSPDASET